MECLMPIKPYALNSICIYTLSCQSTKKVKIDGFVKHCLLHPSSFHTIVSSILNCILQRCNLFQNYLYYHAHQTSFYLFFSFFKVQMILLLRAHIEFIASLCNFCSPSHRLIHLLHRIYDYYIIKQFPAPYPQLVRDVCFFILDLGQATSLLTLGLIKKGC